MTVARGEAADFLERELRLEGASGRYRRDIAGYWTFGDDRVFGGYSVALALAAAASAVELPLLLSCHAVFVDATRIGSAEIEVETLVRGRNAAAVRIVLQQNGATTLAVQAWLGARLPSPARGSLQPLAPAPESCADIRFRAKDIPFMGVMDERAVDYPASEERFLHGPPLVDVWSRPRQRVAQSTPLLSQLFDVIALDAHMLDPTRRARLDAQVQTASLDLNVMWYAVLELPAWRRVQVESGASEHGFAATSATLRDEYGVLCARATQQGRVRRSRASGNSPHASI